MQLQLDNPHAMDPTRFAAAFRHYLDAYIAAHPEEIELLPDDVGLDGTCRDCGYDPATRPTRFLATTDDAKGYVSIARVRAAIDAGWDGRSGCWARRPLPRRIHQALTAAGAQQRPVLTVVRNPGERPDDRA